MPTPEESSITPTSSPLGIIAGAGMLPVALVKKCEEQGRPVAVIALKGFAKIDDFAPHLRVIVPIGRGRSMIRFFRNHQVRDIVFIGAVRRPSWWDVWPDFWTLTRMGPLLLRKALGDDGLLRGIRRIFEHEGFSIQAVQTYLPDLIAQAGPIGQVSPLANHVLDIQRGFEVTHALGQVDVGQSVVVQGGIVLGVEAAEGTSELIRRCGLLKRQGPGPVLIKAAKPNQDHALDLPTVGPDTVKMAEQAGFSGIVIKAGSTLVVDPLETARLADQAQIFVYGHS